MQPSVHYEAVAAERVQNVSTVSGMGPDRVLSSIVTVHGAGVYCCEWSGIRQYQVFGLALSDAWPSLRNLHLFSHFHSAHFT